MAAKNRQKLVKSAVLILSIITGYIVFVGFSGQLFPQILVPVEHLTTTNEMELMPSFELHLWSLLGDKQNFWQIFILSGPWIMLIPCVLLLLLLLLLLQQRQHREKEQNPAEVQMILQEHESIMQQLRAMIALMQDSQDKHCIQLQNEIESMKEVGKAKERHLDQIQHMMMGLVKMIKVGNEHLAQLENEVDLIQKAREEKNEHLTQIEEEMLSIKTAVQKSISVPMEQMAGDPASMESLVKMRTPRKSYTAASNDAANKKKKKV
ncbi:hypothetical protein B7P43_G05376 [Cryptotermes secundus]|uniref:Uncharacterized protein n=1 Tax=Cryptotermes secundus TaxID=105785 RepID=A0A2J7Q7J8_9NEOP|nr:hypothetical protein B7P43_G05376 [Cryptotermes secundus]